MTYIIATLAFVSFYLMIVISMAGPVNTGTDEGKEVGIIMDMKVKHTKQCMMLLPFHIMGCHTCTSSSLHLSIIIADSNMLCNCFFDF